MTRICRDCGEPFSRNGGPSACSSCRKRLNHARYLSGDAAPKSNQCAECRIWISNGPFCSPECHLEAATRQRKRIEDDRGLYARYKLRAARAKAKASAARALAALARAAEERRTIGATRDRIASPCAPGEAAA